MEVLRTLAMAHPLADKREGAVTLPSPTTEDTLQLHQLATMIRRHIVLILVCVVLGATATYLAADLLRKYTAKALILVEPPAGASNLLAGTAPPSDEQTIIETHIMTLTSRAYLDRVLSSLTVSKDINPATFTILQLERSLKVEQELHSRAIAVTYSAKNAKEAALIANRVTQLYVDQQRSQKRNSLDRQRTEMLARIEGLAHNLDKLVTASKMDGVETAATSELRRRLNEARIFESALERQISMADRQRTSEAGVSVLSAADPPERPSTGTPAILAVPAGLAFAIFGIFVALVLEGSDRSLRSEGDVGTLLGVPCFGMVPRIRPSHDPRVLAKRWLRQPVDPYSEALRCILLQQIVRKDSPPRVVLVTSTSRREGKSTLAFSLAWGAARLGRKTLLLELDWRTGSRDEWRKSGKPGIMELLSSEPAQPIATEARIETVPKLGFDRIGLGCLTGDPATLMAGDSLPRHLDILRASYDLIVIDGPCLHGVAEAPMLGTLADKVLVTVSWGRTRRDLARSALQKFMLQTSRRSSGAGFVGVVVTSVNLRRHARYRFGDVGEALSRL